MRTRTQEQYQIYQGLGSYGPGCSYANDKEDLGFITVTEEIRIKLLGYYYYNNYIIIIITIIIIIFVTTTTTTTILLLSPLILFNLLYT